MVLKSALQESWSSLRNEALKWTSGAAAAVLLWYFAGQLFDRARLTIAAAAVAVPVLGFAWKLISIPARLHKSQKNADEVRATASLLDTLHEEGSRIHAQGALSADFTAWFEQSTEWTQRVENLLKGYNESEAFMFRTRVADPPPADRAWLSAATMKDRKKLVDAFKDRVDKLRLIIGRAYGRSDAVNASAPRP